MKVLIVSHNPVLNTQNSVEYRGLVDEYYMGYNCENKNSRELAEKLLLLVDNSELRLRMGRNARHCAEDPF